MILDDENEMIWEGTFRLPAQSLDVLMFSKLRQYFKLRFTYERRTNVASYTGTSVLDRASNS